MTCAREALSLLREPGTTIASSKLADLFFNKVTHRIDFHAFGTPAKTAGWGRITFPSKLTQKVSLVLRRYRMLSDRRNHYALRLPQFLRTTSFS